MEDFPNLERIKRVVFVDSQWHSTSRILRLKNIKKLKHIKIKTHQTAFWRYQTVGRDCLATIEGTIPLYDGLSRVDAAT